jgi:Ca-activated chloride channel family protein
MPFLVLLLALALASPTRAADAPTLLVLFDGSGSMWGKLAGSLQPKFALAREGLRDGFPRLPRDTRVGLASFGHRRAGTCADIEVVEPPAAGAQERVLQYLERLNPRGRGPIALALKEAAQVIAKDAGKRAILLIHDDLDNCQADPCQMAAELRQRDPTLAVHVVSIGLERIEARRMACLAEATGGKWHYAADATAIAETVSAAVAALGLEAPAALARPRQPLPAEPKAVAPPAGRQPAPAAALPTDGPPRLRLAARIGKDGEVLQVPLRWRVYAAGSAEAKPLAERQEATPEIALGAGRYRVEAYGGLVQTTAEVEVKPAGVSEHVASLEGGLLRVTVRWLRSPSAPTKPADLAILKAGGGRDGGEASAIWIGRSGGEAVLVPPGSLVVEAREGQASARQSVTVAAGAVVDAELVLDAAHLELAALTREGGPLLEGVLFRLIEDDPDAPLGRREVARSTALRPTMVVPAGAYWVSARYGELEARDRIVLKAGEQSRRAVILAMTRIKLSARIAGQSQPLKEGIEYRLIRLDGATPSEIMRTADSAPTAVVAVGRYRIECRLGDVNAGAAVELEARPGLERTIGLEIQAGTVELKSAQGAGGGYADGYWEVEDARGNIVWRTVLAQPRTALAAGRYRARLLVRNQRRERAFEVRAGETAVVEVGRD